MNRILSIDPDLGTDQALEGRCKECIAGGSPARSFFSADDANLVNPVILSNNINPSYRKQGAAIVELVMGMLLLLSMIAFTVFVCRAMSQRNRTLAASRTVAWLYSHADDPEGKDNEWKEDSFKIQLARWHFNHSDPERIVVSKAIGQGLITEGNADALLNAVNDAKDSSVVGSGAELSETGYQEKNKEPIPSPSAFVADAVGSFTREAVKFLTRDFEYCTVQVRASTPLIFGTGFYQLFGWFTGLDANTKEVMLNPSFSGSCTMPMQEGGNGIKDPFGELADTFQNAMGHLKKLVEDTKDDGIYRPYRIGEQTDADPPDLLEKDAFYALLVFEIDEPKHDPLKDGTSATWEGGTAVFHNEDAMNDLLDLCGGVQN